MVTFLKVFVFNVAIIAFFLYVGNSIPQKSEQPPQELTLAADAPIADFIAAGQLIVTDKNRCAQCHSIGQGGQRAPDLEGVGGRAEARLKEPDYKGAATNGAEYLVESLHNPTAYVVANYQPIMPPFGRQLSDMEVVAAVAFLQSLGGEVTVNGAMRFPKWRGEGGGTSAASAMVAVAVPEASGKKGDELLQQWQCVTCHKLDAPDKTVGPSLWDIGARKDSNYIRESILQPDAVVTEGFPPAVMKGTLEGLGFYQKVSLQDLNTIVDYLSSLKGSK
jgi:cytochrome c2